MNERKMSAEEAMDRFKNALTDVVGVIETLAPVCVSTEDLVGVLKLGLENEGQLKLLFATVFGQGKK